MIKKLFLILCALVLCSSSYAGNIKDIKKVIARKNVCDTTYYYADITQNDTYTAGWNSSNQYSGVRYVLSEGICLCSLSFDFQVDGTPTNYWWMMISSLDGSDHLDGVTLQYSDASIPGSTFAAGGNGTYQWNFTPCLTMATGEYGIAVYQMTTDTPTGAPTYNQTHFLRFYVDNADPKTEMTGMKAWRWSAEFPYLEQSTTVGDDPNLKVFIP